MAKKMVYLFDGVKGGNTAKNIFLLGNKGAQLAGIAISVIAAIVTGFITGKIISVLGTRIEPYLDSEEFVDVEA